MEIRRKTSVEIADVRGIGQLTREGIVVTFSLQEGCENFSLLEIQGIRDALTAVLDGSPSRLGPWASLDDVPADVSTIVDRDGDELNRVDGVWPTMWHGTAHIYGPYRLP